MLWTACSVAALLGYFLGSLPFAVWIARMHGVDIFVVGSGNPGATNVKRTVGKRAGNCVFVLDFLKGALAAFLPSLLFSKVEVLVAAAFCGLLAAIIGHSYSVFLRFRGGKGVATTMGGLLAIVPLVWLIGLFVWMAVYFSLRYVSLASIAFGVSLPISAWCLHEDKLVVVFLMLFAILVIYRHRSNIKRLLNGTEARSQGHQ